MFRACFAVAICLIDGAAAVADQPVEPRRVKVEFFIAEVAPADGLTESMVPGMPPTKIYLPKDAAIITDDIATARVGKDSGNSPALEFSFTEAGAKKLSEISQRNIGKHLAILVDGVVISAPVLMSPMSSQCQLTGAFRQEELERIVRGINGDAGLARIRLVVWGSFLGSVLLLCSVIVYCWRWHRLERRSPPSVE